MTYLRYEKQGDKVTICADQKLKEKNWWWSKIFGFQRDRFVKWELLEQYTVSVKLPPLRPDARKCHYPGKAQVSTQQERPVVGSGSDLGGDDPSGSRLCLFTPSLFPSLCLSLYIYPSLFLSFAAAVSYAFPSVSAVVFCFMYLSLSLCPFFPLVTMATAFPEWGSRGKRANRRYRGAWYSCHSSLSVSLPSQLFISLSLQLTSARGKFSLLAAPCVC